MKNNKILSQVYYEMNSHGEFVITKTALYEIMDAARKDEAIEFTKWIFDNGWALEWFDNNGDGYWQRHHTGDGLSYEQLYQLFKSNQIQ